MFKPKILTVMKDYSKQQFIADVMASAIVTILAISLSIAFAVSMGVSPEVGLYVSIIASFIVAILGGTYVQVSGPSAVFIVVVAGIMATHGVEGVMITTFLAGIILVLLGVFRLGSLIKYLPYPITTGFMSGAAVVIFTTQIEGFLGLHLENVPSNFLARWVTYFSALNQSDLLTVLIGCLGLAIMILWPKLTKKIPGGLVALVITTLVVEVFGLPVETIGSQFTELALAVPRIQLPSLTPGIVISFLPSAITIAFLCVVSSLLTAVASDTLIGKKHCSNTELVAQGISNMVLGIFGLIPSAGVTTRTMANIESGARTPIAALSHSILLLIALIFLLPLMRLIPMVTLASMLIIASYGMCGWRVFAKMLRAPKGDVLIMLATFFITIAVELSVAVAVGIVLSGVLSIKRMGKKMHIKNDPALSEEFEKEVSVYDVSGPLFFAHTDKFLNSIALHEDLKVVILRLRRVDTMDATAIRSLSILHERCRSLGIVLVLSETLDRPYHSLKKMGMVQQLGKENVCRYFDNALKVARKHLTKQPIQDASSQ